MENDEDLVTRIQIRGTSFMGIYEVVDARLLLYSPDFGEHAEALNGQVAANAATALLTSLVEAAMQNSDVPFMRDDETA